MSRHLLLLSRGLGALPEFVETRVRKHPGAVRVAFVPTAARDRADSGLVDADRRALAAIGYDVSDVDIAEVTGSRLSAALRESDVVYVADGDVFVLLHHMRASGFAWMLPSMLDEGLVYVGAGAGAVVMGPDVSPLSPMHDRSSAPDLTSTTGLHLIGVVPLPHADGALFGREVIERARAQYAREFHLEPLTDEQAIIVEDDAAAVVESVLIDVAPSPG
jgi:dipeptidase E